MTAPGPLPPGRRLLTVVVIMGALLAGTAACQRAASFRADRAPLPAAPAILAARPTAPVDRSAPGDARPVPAALVDASLSLRSGPVAVPLELQLPSLGVRADVMGVGLTAENVMDAPMGRAKDPVWQQAFWYRGGAVPGAPGTALIAGHITDSLGRAAVFAGIDGLRSGDPIVISDARNGLDVRFAVTETATYSLAQAADPAVLTRIYGAGPVAGTGPQPSTDGQSHLTLITCAGTFRNGTHDSRLVVYATRAG